MLRITLGYKSPSWRGRWLGLPWPPYRFNAVLRPPSIATGSTDIATGFPKSDFYNFDTGCTSQTCQQMEKSMSSSSPFSSVPPTSTPDRKTLDARLHDPRFTALPVKTILKIRMDDLGLKNPDLQRALDYARPNVIAMMKSGNMSLPPSKALVAAQLLELDPVFLLSKVISENDPALWDAISAVMEEYLMTKNELAVIKMLRQGLDGHDVDLAALPAFVEVVAPVLNATLDRENALTQAAMERIDK